MKVFICVPPIHLFLRFDDVGRAALVGQVRFEPATVGRTTGVLPYGHEEEYLYFMAEGVGIEPTGDNAIAPLSALKAGTATRRHPLPKIS
jgi:hypothetical protein